MKKIILAFLMAIIFVLLEPTHSYAELSFVGDLNHKTELFKYSLTPGTDEWASLNHGERVAALQIPSDILSEMSTYDLTTAVIEYPCFLDIIFYNDFSSGLKIIREHFNGLDALMAREDAGKGLLNKYKSFDLERARELLNEQSFFYYSMKMLYTEAILAQPEVYGQLNKSEMNELLDLVKENYDFRCRNDWNTVSYSAFYESLAAQEGSGERSYVTTVLTPNGTSVTVIVFTGTDATYNDRIAIKNAIEANYPGAVVVGDATNRYNCHAYAWANSTSVWMNDPSAYWLDGSYSLKSGLAVGYRIYYPATGLEHSGKIVRSSGNTVRSKWGDKSLVEHSMPNCPYYFVPLAVRYYG